MFLLLLTAPRLSAEFSGILKQKRIKFLFLRVLHQQNLHRWQDAPLQIPSLISILCHKKGKLLAHETEVTSLPLMDKQNPNILRLVVSAC